MDESTLLLGTQCLIRHRHLSIGLDQPDHEDRLNKATIPDDDILAVRSASVKTIVYIVYRFCQVSAVHPSRAVFCGVFRRL
jgi:hypothetical protein